MKTALYLIVAISLFTSALCSAQSLSIRPETGLNISHPQLVYKSAFGDKEPTIKSQLGLRAGIYVKVALKKGLYIEPGVLYSAKGYERNDLIFETDFDPNTGALISYTQYRLRYGALELPINVGYSVKLRNIGNLSFYTGPYLGVNFTGKRILKSSNYTPSRSLDIGSGKHDDITLMDAGVNFGLSYQTSFGLYLRTQYGWGLANLIPEVQGNILKNRVWSFTIGYDIKFKK